ncbi:conserved hypothetical protein [Theileria equi strain WA]|uniref:GPI mannosyltransferase 2 n=1 Tax=Theileria equi strain WA TaxID=1537102 RepID=L1LCB9_THEEQ|nr:conserved hypothetical protein [Theileria equi strain WA]EKX72991.1 conserved hypothetical protein [Theileria equi strain WA]|eukprot:XP_004832443.1 conserved hypothetical protein [Theileria equi strain WA]
MAKDESHEEVVPLDKIELQSKNVVYGNTTYPYTTLMGFLDKNEQDDFFKGYKFKLWIKLLPFLSWDAERFLKYSTDDLVYGTEDSTAFFPLLPYLSNLAGKCLGLCHKFLIDKGFFNDGTELPKFMYIAIAGLLITNVSAIISAVLIYLLCWKLLLRRKCLNDLGDGYFDTGIRWTGVYEEVKFKKIERISYLASILYNICPAAIHASALYTESVFSLFSFLAILCLFEAEEIFYSKEYSSFLYTLQKYILEIAAVFLFFLCCFLRSNGIMLAIPLFFHTLRTCPLLSKFNILMEHYKPMWTERNERSSKLYFVIAAIFHWIKAAFYAATLALPLICLQFYGYVVYCLVTPLDDIKLLSFPKFLRAALTKGGIKRFLGRASLPTEHRSWCNSRFPNIYKHVQKEYWNLALFWILRNPVRLHMLLYTGGTIMICVFCLIRYKNFVRELYRKLYDYRLGQDGKTGGLCSKITLLVSLLSHPEVGLVLHLLSTLFTFLFYGHTNVLMRQTLCLIAYHLHFAIIVERIRHINHWKWESLCKLDIEIMVAFFLLLQNVLLCFIGIALFSNFLGWT